jgi:hypothetical protein
MTQELIRQMLDNIVNDDQAAAQQDFESIISVKLTDVLDQRKQDIAHQLGARDANLQTDS